MSDVSRIISALQFIDNSDREGWVHAGMAVKSELGDAGFDVWDSWSSSAESYSQDDAKSVWRSIKPSGGINVGSLFYEAKQNGWHDDQPYQKPSLAEIAERDRKAKEQAAKNEAEIAAERKSTAEKAAAIWKAAAPAQADNPYLVRKKVQPVATLKEIDATKATEILGYVPKSGDEPLQGRLLVVPVSQGKVISTLELIDGGGRKAALAGRGTKSGGYWATSRLPDSDGEGLTLLVGEGTATCLSAHEATTLISVAALANSNLPKVVAELRKRYPKAKLVVLADINKETGKPDKFATQAAREYGGYLAVPDFGDTRPEGVTDFNDLHQAKVLEAVKRCIEAALTIAPENDNAGWPAPQPLISKIEPEPYPLDALPASIRSAAEEVAAFVKAPIPLVAASALSAVSIACQAHVDVKRSEKLTSPSGLFLLTIADSGERKSTCDSMFTTPIRQHQDLQAERMAADLRRNKADIAAWEAKRDGLLLAIKSASKSGDTPEVEKKQTDLIQLESEKPASLRIQRLLFSDATPESLAWNLANKWPSGGVISSEAGAVFGAHGMGKDSIMRNLALLNTLWDGGIHTVDRRTSESFTVQGARLTVGLQVQEATLRDFFSRSGELARGTGFLARFLVAWPESTQGTRLFTEAPNKWPSLEVFHKRLAKILNQQSPINDAGGLDPLMLTLTPEAKAAWIKYHNDVEIELFRGGELHDIKDVASKSADNAARLAALFHLFEGRDGAIGLDDFNGASMIAAWHLGESRRFFGELAFPPEIADAVRLNDWLVERCRSSHTHMIPRRDAQQFSPVRDKLRLDAAIKELIELDRVALDEDGRKKTLRVNPILLSETDK
ncbi:MAG: DUF3987 domain-containing protein [Methylobacillus sp.]|jgi:putative DNA primase/helicase|nr:DUF3987 domain-containing protein [Methylobacillus sp.]